MRKFDTKIQYLNYKVLREVARFAWNDTLLENIINIPQIVVPGDTATMRCCIYKERAILGERIKLAMGGDRENPNVIEVIEIACDECPMSGYEVTDACRGCLAHRCDDVCPKNAITYDQNYVAHIDKTKCVNCGACARACPYSAITNRRRPCESACKVKAISMSEKGPAEIHNDKCVECGACVYHCPFGAVLDKAYILDVIDMIKKSENNSKYKVYAMVAPAIASQFTFARTRQVIEGIKRLGFYDVTEAALGADMVAYEESKELAEKGFLISSCCPAFVEYIHKNFSDLEQYVSHNLSPMATLGKYIKEKDPTAKVVFIGPCTAKKEEAQKETVKPYIDAVITFEELQALFDSKDIEITELPDADLEGASYYGRIFARSGGLAEAVAQGLKEHGRADFELKPLSCGGIEECRTALLKKKSGKLDANFIEGMACVGGCINGAGCLTHGGERSRSEVDKYGKKAGEKTIAEAVLEAEAIF